eukprot:1483653-Rhodomonas_salina.3
MAEARKPLPWPSIEQLPREVCIRLSRFLHAVDAAVVCIQRAWRKKKGKPLGEKEGPLKSQAKEAFAGACRSDLFSLLLRAKSVSSEKLDGTNVGKASDETLLGRRMVIAEAAKTYQGCPLEALRSLNTDPCLQEISQILLPSGGGGVKNCAVYGELCCNPGLYSYQTRNLPQTWQLFGVIFEFSDAQTANMAAEQARARGLVCITQDSSVRVCNCPALSAIFEKHSLPYIESEAYPSLCELVARKKGWMTAEGGEGVVLSIDNGAHSAAFKWKISREAQPGTISQLAALISALRPEMGEQALKASLLDPLILQLLADLYAVATHVDSKSLEEAACKEKKGKNKKEQKQEPRVLDARAVQVALASALTKFDSLDAAFQTGGRAAIPKLVERLAQV